MKKKAPVREKDMSDKQKALETALLQIENSSARRRHAPEPDEHPQRGVPSLRAPSRLITRWG
jgi:hypothetical protein